MNVQSRPAGKTRPPSPRGSAWHGVVALALGLAAFASPMVGSPAGAQDATPAPVEPAMPGDLGPPPPTTTETMRVGPFDLAPQGQPGDQVERLGDLVPRPSGDLAIRSVKFRLVDAAGNNVTAPIAHLHHMVLLDSGRPDRLCSYPPASRFAATGMEQTNLGFPEPYAYHSPADSQWAGVYHVMNMSPAPISVSIEYSVTYSDASLGGYLDLEPFFLDVTGCWGNSEFNVPGDGGPGSVLEQSKTYTMDQAGTIVVAGGHIHPGGIDIALTDSSGADVCRSTAEYGPAPMPSEIPPPDGSTTTTTMPDMHHPPSTTMTMPEMVGDEPSGESAGAPHPASSTERSTIEPSTTAPATTPTTADDAGAPVPTTTMPDMDHMHGDHPMLESISPCPDMDYSFDKDDQLKLTARYDNENPVEGAMGIMMAYIHLTGPPPEKPKIEFSVDGLGRHGITGTVTCNRAMTVWVGASLDQDLPGYEPVYANVYQSEGLSCSPGSPTNFALPLSGAGILRPGPAHMYGYASPDGLDALVQIDSEMQVTSKIDLWRPVKKSGPNRIHIHSRPVAGADGPMITGNITCDTPQTLGVSVNGRQLYKGNATEFYGYQDSLVCDGVTEFAVTLNSFPGGLRADKADVTVTAYDYPNWQAEPSQRSQRIRFPRPPEGGRQWPTPTYPEDDFVDGAAPVEGVGGTVPATAPAAVAVPLNEDQGGR